MRTYTTPGGTVSRLALDLLNQPHALIAGATGSGKSVMINSIIFTALHFAPSEKELILIDPKRVELIDYQKIPHTRLYASKSAEIVRTLSAAVDLMERRFIYMQRRRLKEWPHEHTYIIVDEFADLITTQKRQTVPNICRIAQLGRAARVHLILATQRPTRDIITGQIAVNIDARLALRCPTAQDSRNIIHQTGAEMLPRYGQGLYLTPETMHPVPVIIPYTPPEEINRIITHWTR